jgi:hypothetical protein
LEYEVVTEESLAGQSTDDLMLRLMCMCIVRGQHQQQLVDSLQMRSLALHMQARISCYALASASSSVQGALDACKSLWLRSLASEEYTTSKHFVFHSATGLLVTVLCM